MAIFGWLVLCGIFLFCTAQALFLLWFCMPECNPIGGAENSTLSKVVTVLYCVIIGCAWYWLLNHMPFNIVITQ